MSRIIGSFRTAALALAIAPALVLSSASPFSATPAAAQGTPPAATAPQPVTIVAGTDTLRGRFYATTAATPLATVVLFPGFGGTTGDVLGLGTALSARDVHVLVVNSRGTQDSQGTLTWTTGVADVDAVITWLRSPGTRQRYTVDPARVVVGGHSFGGTMAILGAARDSSIRRVISFAGADHATYAARLRDEPGYRAQITATLRTAQRPRGTITLDPEALVEEMDRRGPEFAHPPLAPRFRGRAVLLVGGWDDATCVVERELTPFYRALRTVEGADATLMTYMDGHGFAAHRAQLATDVHAWLVRTTPVR
jgi:uncharacterized protein